MLWREGSPGCGTEPVRRVGWGGVPWSAKRRDVTEGKREDRGWGNRRSWQASEGVRCGKPLALTFATGGRVAHAGRILEYVNRTHSEEHRRAVRQPQAKFNVPRELRVVSGARGAFW